MASRTAHQQRDTSRARSQDPSRYPPREQLIDLPQTHGDRSASVSSKAGTKRLFSNRASRISANSEDQDGEYGVTTTYDDDTDDGAHSEKRPRPSDWPLSNTRPPLPAAGTTPSGRARPRNKSRTAPGSPPFRRRSSSQARPSKFVEGSMNDRASMVPPTPYLDAEEYQFGEGHGDTGYTRWSKTGPSARKPTHNTDTSAAESSSSVAERSSEVSRHSGIFRFGKSLASTFNPSNWKIWSKQPHQQNHQHQPVVDDEEATQRRILQERQEKAERIYMELKKAGQFPQQQNHEHQKSSPTKHDSAVALYDEEEVYTVLRRSADVSQDEKRKGKVYLEPPSFPQNSSRRGESPASFSGSAAGHSNNSSPSKLSFSLKRASFSNIKRAFTSDSTTDLNESESHHHHAARRIPSRKDLQKQQKLVKRVSDLEGKLEAARRQLTESLAEPVPSQPQPPPRIGRSRFVPGALSTLPSERLLSGYVAPEEADASKDEAYDGIGRAVTVDHPKEGGTSAGPRMGAGSGSSVKLLSCPPSDAVLQSVETDGISNGMATVQTQRIRVEERASSSTSSDLSPPEEGQELGKESTPQPQVKPTHRKPTPKKRKSAFEGLADDGGRYKPSATDGESDEGSEIIKKLAVKKNSTTTSRPRKLQRVAQASSIPKEPTPARTNRIASASSIPTPRNRSASSRLVKSNPRNSRQSMSPPPSSTFTGLDNANPSTHLSSSSKTTKNSEQLASPTKGAAYMANPAMGGDVPPMPKLPKAVRLASGEVISTAAASSQVPAGEGKKKLRKEKKPVAEQSREKESFEWPADVF